MKIPLNRMMKRALICLLVIVLLLFSFLTWYKLTYTMAIAEPFTVAAENSQHSVLIATQGSEFKQQVVSGLIDHFAQQPVSIEVIDVTELNSVRVGDWDGIVVIHTWEQWQPQPDAAAFLNANRERTHIVVLTTSGQGTMKMDGIDAITSASVISEANKHANTLAARMSQILGL